MIDLLRKNRFCQIAFYLLMMFVLLFGGLKVSTWLDAYLTGLQGGQVLQGGTFWKALTVSFKDARRPDESVAVTDVRFKNVDRFLPIAVIVHADGRDSTYFAGTQAEQVHIEGVRIDSLVIRTRNASHSAVIDDLTFQVGRKAYRIDFDWGADGAVVLPNTQLLAYQADGVLVRFGADNAVPTVVRGGDLAEAIGRYISELSGPLSTALILVLVALPFWMLVRFAQVVNQDLAADRFFSGQDAEAVARHGIGIFWGGRFAPEGQDYAFDRGSEFTKILASVGSETASDQTRLVEYCTDKIYMLFDEIEDRLSEAFGMMGVLALSLGLLGTVVGMIDAFKILEDTMKVGEGPAQTQLKMAHYINFALVTTAIGFMGRILSIVLIRKVKSRSVQRREQMVSLVQRFGLDAGQEDRVALRPASGEDGA